MISILVVNYNGERTIQQCIESLKNQNFPKDQYEIIVIDNNSTDKSYNLVPRDIKLIKSNTNLGFAKANNLVLKVAKGEYIALLNNDAIADKNWLKELHKEIQKENIGAVCNRVNYGNTNLPWFSGAKIYPINLVKHNYLKNKRGYSDYPCGCSMLIKREVIEKLGYLFDEKFFMYGEDNDLGLRLKKAGYKTLYIPTPITEHLIPVDRLSKNEVYSTFKNRTYLMYKHSKLPKPLFLLLDLAYFKIYALYKTIRTPKIIKYYPTIIKARFDSYKLL